MCGIRALGKYIKLDLICTMGYGLIATELFIIKICKMEMVAMLTATMIHMQDMSLCRAILEHWRPPMDKTTLERLWPGCKMCKTASFAPPAGLYCPWCGTPRVAVAWVELMKRLEVLYEHNA